MANIRKRPVPGQKFSRLLVVEERLIQSHNWRTRKTRYFCKCDCGAFVEVEAYRLVSKHIKSCGCLKSDTARKSGQSMRIHGYAQNGKRIPEYMTWVRMRRRCENPESQDYPNYGARGIKVCESWYKFETFLKDMGRRPGKGYCIDRIDNNGNYEPENCRWATIKESNRNKRTIRLLIIDGVQKTLPEWSDESGTHQETIRSRLRRGWSHKESVFGEIRQVMEKVGNRWKKRNCE